MRLVNCDEIECQDFLFKIVKFCDEDDPARKLMSDNDYLHSRSIAFYLCRLDRACIYLLAKLRAYAYRPILCYGTKIVSFENEQDLINYFTTLELRHVCQMERIIILPTDNEHSDVAYGFKSEKEHRNSRELHLDEDGKLLGHQKNQVDFKQVRKKWEGRGIWYKPPITTTIQLFFYYKPDLFQEIPVPPIKRATKGSNSNHQPLFQAEVKQASDQNLSAITLLVLQVPTLKSATVADGILHPQHVYLLKALKDLRPANGSPLQIQMSCTGSQDDYYVSDDLLNLFNEKKLTRMIINLVHKIEYKLLDKVLETISRSLYIQHLQFLYEETPPNEEEWAQIERFMERLVKIAPTLVRRLLDVDYMFPTYIRNDLTPKVRRLHAQVCKIMALMNDKSLQIINVLAGVKVLDKYKTNSIRMLPIDVLRELRNFLFVDKYRLLYQ